MDDPRNRRQGMAITSAPVAPLINQINHRVQDTETTWNIPHGAETIVKMIAASLSEEDLLDHCRRHRRIC